MRVEVALLLFTFLTLSAGAENEIVCILGNRTLNNCIKSVLIEKLPGLRNPKKQEVYDTIDPFLFDYGKLSFNDSKRFHGSFSVKNVLIEGARNTHFKKIAVKHNSTVMKMLGLIHIPTITVDGLFKSNLRIDNYLFRTHGNFNGSIEDLHGKFVMSGKLIDIGEGLLQFKVENFNIFFTIIDLKIHLYGSQIDDNLSIIIDRIINESWQYVYQDLISRTRFIWEGVAVEMSNEMFSYIKFELQVPMSRGDDA